VRDRARWKTVVLIMMFCVGLVGLMATHEYMGVGEGTSLEQARVGSIAGQPNVLGAFFVYYMFLFPAFWLVNLQRAKAWWLLVPFLLCFRGIMVTFSRGAYVSFLAGLLGFAYFRHKLLALLTAGTIAFVALNPWLLPPGIRYRWDSTFRSDTSLIDAYGTGAQLQEQVDLSSRLRLIIWEGGLKMIQDYPWFGVGYRRFRFRIGEYIIWKRPIDAHNAYLLMAAEFGIPALVFFVLVILLLVRITWVVYRRHPDAFIRTAAHGFLGGLSALALANVFGSRLNTAEVSGYFWILAALMARAHVWVRQPAPEPLAPAQAARRAARVRLPRRRLRAIRAEAA
jgi:O-antigen ligase